MEGLMHVSQQHCAGVARAMWKGQIYIQCSALQRMGIWVLIM